MTYQVNVKRSAEKDLDRLNVVTYHRVREHLLELEANPRPFGAKKLQGSEGYRLRVGDYRVLYEIDDPQRRVTVYSVRHRREVYR